MSKITIIGTSGAGKTVFISVLAERYSKIIPGHAYMEYADAETKLYSAEVWSGLVDRQEWPPSTPSGVPGTLRWILRSATGDSHEINVMDLPGQDVREIYGDATAISPRQKELKNAIEGSDVFVLLVSLPELTETDSFREKTFIVSLAKKLFSRGASVALLFSKHDRFCELLSEKGRPASGDSMDVLREYLPELLAPIKEAEKKAYVGFVSAVAETETILDSKLNTISRPKKDFRSEGLPEIISWLTAACRAVEENKKNPPQSVDSSSHSTAQPPPPLSEPKKSKLSPNYSIGFIESWKRLFQRTFNFSGRATRAEYWKTLPLWWLFGKVLSPFLGLELGSVFGTFIEAAESQGAIDFWVTVLCLLLLFLDFLISFPFLALAVRRAHDSGASALPPSVVFAFSLLSGLYQFSGDASGISYLWGRVYLFFETIGPICILAAIVAAVSGLYFLILSFRDSAKGKNKYGDSEKYPQSLQ